MLACPSDFLTHPGGNPGSNLKSISHRCYLREVESEWELTKETIYLPLGCLQGGVGSSKPFFDPRGFTWGGWWRGVGLSHTMYHLNSLSKLTPPRNRPLIILISNSQQ